MYFCECPPVWDTGASFGLTLVRADFIDYVKCRILAHDVTRTNVVVEIGTPLCILDVIGEAVYLPWLSDHLPSADNCAFFPQAFHALYGGHHVVFGDKAIKFIDKV